MKQTFAATPGDAGGDDSLAALLARVERMELALRATNEGLFDTDLIAREVYYSPRWKAMLGYADDEIGTSIDEWRHRIHPDDIDDAWRHINAHLSGETPTCEFEHRLRHKDGSYRWFFERAIATRDETGRAIRVTGSNADITDRKLAEDTIARRDEILDAVRFAADHFLGADTPWEVSVQEVLARLAHATRVSRTYVFENHLDDEGELRTSIIHEWVAPGVTPWIDNPLYQAIPLRQIGLGRWMEVLGSGQVMHGHLRDLPESERPVRDGEQTLSFVSVPIFVDGAWWGAIGFDELTGEREFSAPERDALRAAAGTLGAAIGRKRADAVLARRDAILEAVRFATERYLRNPVSWDENVVEMLGMFGEALGVSRVYIFENEIDAGGELRCYLRHEWWEAGAGSLIVPGADPLRPFGDSGWHRWKTLLGRGESVAGRIRDFPADEQVELRREDTLSLAMVPIFVDEGWWGFIGFDDCVEERQWSSVELDALKAAAGTLGGAIQRDRADAASAHLAAIVESTNDAIFGMLRNGTITSWNAAAERLYGYAETEMVGDRVHKLLSAGEVERLRRVLIAITAGEQVEAHEAEVVRKDGTPIWVAMTFSLIRDADGEPEGTSAIGRDISARRRAEQDLRQRDDILEAVRFAAERFLDPVTTWEQTVQDVLARLGSATGVCQVYVSRNRVDEAGEIWFVNDHEWAAPGRSPHPSRQRLQETPLRAFGLDYLIERFGRGETVHGQARDFPAAARSHVEGQGVVSWVIVPIFVDGAWWGVIGFDECEREREFSAPERDALKAAADTLGAAIGRERAEAELRESQRSLRTLLSNLPGVAYRRHYNDDGLWELDFVSEGSLALSGYHPSELMGPNRMPPSSITHPDDRPRVLGEIDAALARDEPFQVSYRMRTASGGEKWVLDQGRGVRDEAGQLLAIEGIITDITERVLARQQLELRVEERTRELATLLNVSTTLASTLELRPLLGQILDQFRQVVEHTSAAIFLLDGETGRRMLDYRGPVSQAVLSPVRPLHEVSHSREVVVTRKPVIIPDIRADTPLAAAFRADVIHDLGAVPDYAGSWMGVPLIFREQVIGLLTVVGAEVDAYTARDAELALAFAAQAAVAIVNARLYEQAQGTAALEERQRLARELHDSVSQALFGIGLGARTARTLLDENPADAAAPLDYVLSLAEAGLTEMRALIFELRPEALEQEGLVAALEKQAANLRARHGITVEADLGDPGKSSLAVEEAIYRIAQEALNNTAKHARATTVRLRLAREAGRLVAEIADDGSGFDPAASYSGHLGLRTMRERAERLGGSLSIESVPGTGTRLRVTIPV